MSFLTYSICDVEQPGKLKFMFWTVGENRTARRETNTLLKPHRKASAEFQTLTFSCNATDYTLIQHATAIIVF